MANAEPTKTDDWLLYGAYGYSGALIAEEAVKQGLRPVLAGRRAEALQPLAERLGLAFRVLSLDGDGDGDTLAAALAPFRAVLHAAGPFGATATPMADACLRAGASYLDINGEWAIFERIYERDQAARAAGVTLLPGVGFDVVPSDCLAAALHAALPGATTLELGWGGLGRPSPGTAKSMLEGLGQGNAVRRDGRMVPARSGGPWRRVPFRDGKAWAVAIPWGDLASAWRSTGIPNITVYSALPLPSLLALQLMGPMRPLLRSRALKRWLGGVIERRVHGPDERLLSEGRSHLWGRVSDGNGGERSATLEAPEGYRLTALAAVECVRRVLAGAAPVGAHTPASAFGPALLDSIPGCDLRLAA